MVTPKIALCSVGSDLAGPFMLLDLMARFSLV